MTISSRKSKSDYLDQEERFGHKVKKLQQSKQQQYEADLEIKQWKKIISKLPLQKMSSD